MTLPTATTVANLAREQVVKGWYPKGFVDQFIRKICFERVDMPGETIDWNRATSLTTIPPYAQGGSLGTTVMDTTKFQGDFRRIGDVAEVDYFHQTASSDPNEQLQVQIESKKVGVIRSLGSQIIT